MPLKLFKRKKDIESMRAKLIKELTFTHGYSILKSSNTLREDNEYILNLAKQYDELGYMSENLGSELDNLFVAQDYIVGIHRTGYTHMNKDVIQSIFNKGLINNGHIMQGGMSGNCDIENTVTLFSDFTIFNGQLKVAQGYKGSEGCIIVKIPKSYLGKSQGDIKPIYYKEGNINRLLPEFIYGYVPIIDVNGVLGSIQRNPNYKDQHNLDNPNLIYDDSVFYKAKREGISLKIEDIPLDKKYEILEKAYKDTLLKYGEYQAEQALLNLINKNETKYFTGNQNRNLLNKYIIYGDILKILSLGLDLSNSDINEILNEFINQNKQENNKIR